MTHPTDGTQEPPLLYAVANDDDLRYNREPPHDHDAEQATLGAAMLDNTALHAVTSALDPSDFYTPRHEAIYTAICDLVAGGLPVDVVTVADHLVKTGEIHRAGGAPYLHTLISTVPTAGNADYYAGILRDKATLRRLVVAGNKITNLGHAATGGNIADLAAAAEAEIRAATHTLAGTNGPRARNIDDFLATEDPEHSWLIPGLLERGDRLVLTAGEGHGKSTLLRQIGVQAAAGIHPFTHARHDPIRVLLVDLENSERQTRRKLRPLRLAARDLNPANLHIMCKIDGLDLTQAADEQWLANLVAAHRADLLITGPIYKLSGGDPTTEKDSKPAAMALDRIRAAHDCAIILEAHSKKAEGYDGKKRSKEPYGWSGWLRWPEFGLHLAEDGTLSHWRGDREEGREFPTALNRGGTWPWTADNAIGRAELDIRWQQVKRAITQAGTRLSNREISEACGLSKSTVHRILGAYSMQHAALIARLEQDDES